MRGISEDRHIIEGALTRHKGEIPIMQCLQCEKRTAQRGSSYCAYERYTSRCYVLRCKIAPLPNGKDRPSDTWSLCAYHEKMRGDEPMPRFLASFAR
jgi:hypothetical protein